MKHKKDYKDIQKYKKGIFTKYCIKVRGKSLRCPTSHGNDKIQKNLLKIIDFLFHTVFLETNYKKQRKSNEYF